LPPTDPNTTHDVPALCDYTRKNCPAPFKELVLKLQYSTSKVPPVTCIVSDGILGFDREVAKELGIPDVQFWTASACGFMGYLNFSKLVKIDVIPFKGMY
jgi:hypothetical protein